jgi:hypothetical protein
MPEVSAKNYEVVTHSFGRLVTLRPRPPRNGQTFLLGVGSDGSVNASEHRYGTLHKLGLPVLVEHALLQAAIRNGAVKARRM